MHLSAQEDLVITHRHEVKLNLGSSVFFVFSEVSYEYLLNEDMTMGAAVGFGFDTDNSDGYSFKATPFARWFFGEWSWFRGHGMQHPSTGFFLEANGALGTKDGYTYIYLSTGSNNSWKTESESMFTAGLGLAVGWKYLSQNNWTAELFTGLGRNIIYDKNEDDVSLSARIGVSIGKRFWSC